MPPRQDAPPASQTLSRGIRLLEELADARAPLTIDDLAARVGLHRSVAYRLLRTLEDHGLVTRDAAGAVRLGTGLAALAAGVAADLQAEALPELTAAANDLGMTCFLVVLDHDEGLSNGDLADQIDRPAGFASAHARRGFVEQNDIGAACDGDADFEGPLLGIGQDAGQDVPALRQSDPGQDIRDLRRHVGQTIGPSPEAIAIATRPEDGASDVLGHR